MNQNSSILNQAEPYRHRKRRKKLWQRAVSTLACLVVFITTYVLILPAFTLDKSPVCGYEEHRHDSSCYVMPEPVSQLSCSAAPHRHTEECGDSCGYADFFLHSHATDHSEFGNYVCKLPELEAHVHDSGCYNEVTPMVCGTEESLGHTHGTECFTRVSALSCTEPEAEAHTHTDTCFDESGEPVCGLVESTGHTHGDECFTEGQELVCQTPESEGHTHTDACLGETEKILVCQKTEYIPHTHTDACFDANGSVICSLVELVEHIHGEGCLGENRVQGEPVLICERTEHIHNDGCYGTSETTSATETEAATDPTGVTETVDATEPMEDTEPTEPVEDTEPTEPVEDTEPTEPVEDTEPTEPVEDTEPTEVTEPQVLETITVTAQIYTDGTYSVLSEDATVITVTGVIPADAQVLAYPVTVENQGSVLCAYDLTILLPDGTVFEPTDGERLNVSIQAPDLSGDSYYPEVYYIPEEGEPQPIDTVVTEDGIQFQTDHFSVYAVMAVDTVERIPNGAKGSYYHSTSLPRYQISPYLVNERIILYNSVHAVETYVLVSVDEYGGKSWTPDSISWSAAGNHNYVVTYCCDYNNYVSSTGNTFYMYKIPLWNSKFNNAQRAALQAIIENAYPFITEAEMQQRLADAGYTGTFTASEMLCATQLAIWKWSDNESPSVHDNQVPDNRKVLNPITTKAPGTKNDVDKIYDFLMNDAATADPGNLEVTDTRWDLNEDGGYSVTVELNRPVVEGETLTATLSSGSYAIPQEIAPGTQRFTLVWPAGMNEGTNIDLTLTGSRTAFVVYYYDDGGRVQDLISGEYDKVDMNFHEVLVRSVTNVTVEKKWVEVDPTLRPEGITVYLTVNGERKVQDGVSPIVLNEDNGWTYTWKNLPTANNLTTLVYGVEEVVPAGYVSSVTTQSSKKSIVVTITNTQIPVDKQTELKVIKEWSDGADLHSEESVLVRLYADGVYTGQFRILSQENLWTATFSQLPYYAEDGITPIVYTIVEDDVPGYVPEYSDPLSMDPDDQTNWIATDTLQPGSIYRLLTNGNALGVDANGNLIAAADDSADPTQWWLVAAADSSFVLNNVGSGKALTFADGLFSTGETGAVLQLTNGMLGHTPGDDGTVYYLCLSGELAYFQPMEKTTSQTVPVYTITVTNRPESGYELPHTGGMGAELFTLGGAALAAAAWICAVPRKNKRKTH